MIDWPATLATHSRWLRTALFVRLGEAQAVDEVMREVAFAAVSLRAPLCDPTRAGAWLYRVALRQALLYCRRQGRQRKALAEYARLKNESCSNIPDPLAILLLAERRQRVRDALGKLARRDQEILLLKYTEDWSCAELARHLGVGERCIETRLNRARGRLREAMTELTPD